MQPRVITKRNKQTRNIPFSHSLGEPFSGKEATEERTPSWNLRIQVPLPMCPSEKCVYVPFSVPLPHKPPLPQHSSPGQGEASRHKALCVWGGMCSPHPSTQRTQCPFCSLCSAPLPTTSQVHMPGCNWLLAQDSPLILGLQGILSGFQEPPAQFPVPQSPNPADAPGPSPWPSYGSWGSLVQPQSYPGCAALLLFG